MKVSPAKENILKKIRNALSQPVQLPFPHAEGKSNIFSDQEEQAEIKFAEEFSKLQGKFVFCTDHTELVQNLLALSENYNWKNLHCKEPALVELLKEYKLPFLNKSIDIKDADAGITGCEMLVARTGSVVMSAAQPSGRIVPVFSPVHIVIAYRNQLAHDIRDAITKLKEKYDGNLPSMISFQTGPSRTADIEKTLVVGIHGPKEVFVFLIDEDKE